MDEQKKDFNTTISGIWKNRNGYQTMVVDAKLYDLIQKIEIGGRLFIKIMDEEKRAHEKSPYGYIEYMSKEKVQRAPAGYANRQAPPANPQANSADPI